MSSDGKTVSPDTVRATQPPTPPMGTVPDIDPDPDPDDLALHVVNVLNRALRTDRNTIEGIFADTARIPCSAALADDPTIQVRDNGEGETPRYTLGVLGLLNGIIGVRDDGWGYVARVYGEDGLLTHFKVLGPKGIPK